MATLFGKNFTKRELLRRVGDMSQIACIRQVELQNGGERGVRALEFKSGSGLAFTVLADRAMDIFDASFQGQSLCWHSPSGPVAPAFYDRHDIGWLWSFPGGLLITCGLTHVGHPDLDEQLDEELGLHGRISNVPAKNVSFGEEWEDDDYILWASGEIREARLFGPNLLIKRTIHAKLGESKIWIKDIVENQGFEPSPFMILYHCNMGFPLVSEGAELRAVINNVLPRDEEAEKGVENFDRFESPTPGYMEQVFFVDHDENDRGLVNVALVNRTFNNNQGFGISLSYPKKELPYYTQWKMVGEGAYVVGMEPGNCIPEGRPGARNRDVLQVLEPGASQTFHIEVGVLASNEEIRAFESQMREKG